MIHGLVVGSPLFVGPTAFLLAILLGAVVLLAIVGLLFSLPWRVIVVAALVVGVLWLAGVIGFGSPTPGPPGQLLVIR